MESLQGWLNLGIILAVYLITVTVAWQKIIARLNGLGRRVAGAEASCATHEGRLDEMREELISARGESTAVFQRLGKVEASTQAVSEKLTDVQINLAGHLGEIKNLIVEKDSATRERLAAIEANQRR
jgi:chromosome segregation ATPase